jgi:hypothetical protein
MPSDLNACFAGIAAGRVTGVARVATVLEQLCLNHMPLSDAATPPAQLCVTGVAASAVATPVTPDPAPGVAEARSAKPRQNGQIQPSATPVTPVTPLQAELSALWDAFQERAALMTFEGGLLPAEAERRAFCDVLACWIEESPSLPAKNF